MAASQLVESVKTLLSLGADPNYTNGHRDSFALANAVHGSALLLRSMLDAGGNPNARDEFGRPIILMNWYLGYYPNDQRVRLDLLLRSRCRYQFYDAPKRIGLRWLYLVALSHENGT